MPSNDFAPFRKRHTVFRVRNIADPKKTIRIFHYPILAGQERDLLEIPGVSEADIRASLLKGEVIHKFLAQEIIVIDSDIDLLQFNDDQKSLLQSTGIIKGLEVNGVVSTIPYVWREKIPLIGMKNSSNRVYYTPDKFINGSYYDNIFHITVEHNGKELYENIDFTIAESSGPGTGYDTLNLISFSPNQHSLLYATYAVKAI